MRSSPADVDGHGWKLARRFGGRFGVDQGLGVFVSGVGAQ